LAVPCPVQHQIMTMGSGQPFQGCGPKNTDRCSSNSCPCSILHNVHDLVINRGLSMQWKICF
jgi:hypothetical protein